MSQSLLFKSIVLKNVEKEYIYVLYKNEKTLFSEKMQPIKICISYEDAIHNFIKLNIHEFCDNYIISENLIKILKSNKSNNVKYNSIIFEYDKIFKNNKNKFNIKIKIIEKTSNDLNNILREIRIYNNDFKNTNKKGLKMMDDYIKFYNFAKTKINNI